MPVTAPENIDYSLLIDCPRRPGDDPVTITDIRDIIGRTGAETLSATALAPEYERFQAELSVPNSTGTAAGSYPDQIRQAFSDAGLSVIKCQQLQ